MVMFDRSTRIKLFLRSIQTFAEEFDERGLVGIPAEALEQTWEKFRSEIRELHKRHSSDDTAEAES